MITVRFCPIARAVGRLSLALALLWPAFAVVAATPAKSTVTVSSAVSNSCVIVSSDTISFGSYDPTSTLALTGTGQLHLTCTKGAAVSALPTSGGTTLTGAKGSMAYSLYVDSGMSKIWGGQSYTYYTANFASASVSANFQQFMTQTACQSLANGTAYYYQVSSTMCGYNLGNPSNSASKTTLYGSVSSVVLVAMGGGQTVLQNGPHGLDNTFYLPSATSTQVSGLTYTVPSLVSGAANQALTGTATSAKQPLNLAYYAKVPASQDMATGFYQDTVVVSVTF